MLSLLFTILTTHPLCFELTELDHLALATTCAPAHTLYDSVDDLLGIHDPDLLDIPPPMMYEEWSDGVEGRRTE